MKRETVTNVISYAFILLFVYTALSKWFAFSIYLYDLKRSPELAAFALSISIVFPAAELITAAFLLFSRTRMIGLWGAFILMLLFTIYVGWVLLYASELPCTCGGIIRELSWPNHLIFNLTFTILGALGIWLEKQNPGRTQKRHLLTS